MTDVCERSWVLSGIRFTVVQARTSWNDVRLLWHCTVCGMKSQAYHGQDGIVPASREIKEAHREESCSRRLSKAVLDT